MALRTYSSVPPTQTPTPTPPMTPPSRPQPVPPQPQPLPSHQAAPPPPPPPKSKHALLYSDIFPPMFRVLAYSTATYFALHLAWTYLRNEEEARAQDAEITELREAIRTARSV
ncbi:hypothetical protein ACI68E_003740 [Malassezia pachydermatis]